MIRNLYPNNLILLFLFLFFSSTFSQSITITLAGDFMVGSWGIPLVQERGFQYPIQNVQSLFKESDLNLCNLEVPITVQSDTFPGKTFHFKIPPEFVKILQLLPIHYVTLANNHILDYQEDGLFETMETLQKAGIAFSGAGANLSLASQPAIIKKNGIKIGIIAAGAIFPKGFWATDSTPGIFFPWKKRLLNMVDSTRKVVDLLLVTFHWGAEKKETPKQYQISLAHQVIQHGADLVWGHHPHVIQGIEFYRGKPIFYSLGNFIFASYSKSQNGMVAQVEYEGKKIQKIKLFPLKLDNDPPLQPQFMFGDSAYAFLEKAKSLSDSIKASSIIIDPLSGEVIQIPQ